MPQIIQNRGDVNLYLYAGGTWYRYDTTVAPLGVGAMGIVRLGFRCDDNTPVAIKAIRPELQGNPLIRYRFKLEASIVIDHPNVVKMLGSCEEYPGYGRFYVISEYISGVTFEEHIKSRLSAMPTEDRDRKIVEDFIPIIEAVDYLHSNGIIHRDIKPDNLMIQDGYLPKLMDLGIAKTDSFGDARLTGTIGSVPFAAPEQVVAEDVVAEVDNRSDIYSLGATLQYLITGDYPSDMSGHSEKLTSIISKAVADDPAYRFQDALSLKKALEAYLNPRPQGKTIYIVIACVSIVALLLFLTLL